MHGEEKDQEKITIRIKQHGSNSHEGCVIWGCGVAMACLAKSKGLRKWCNGKITVELGSGTGLTSIVAAHFWENSKIIATDIPEIIPLLVENVNSVEDERYRTRLSVVQHTWGKQMSESLDLHFPIDLVMLADVVYFSQYHEDLFLSLDYIARHCPKVIFLLMHRVRNEGSEHGFFDHLRTRFACRSIALQILVESRIVSVDEKTEFDALNPDTFVWMFGPDEQVVDDVFTSITTVTTE